MFTVFTDSLKGDRTKW